MGLNGVQHTFSAELRDFLNRCVQIDADKRDTAEALLQHPWILRNRENFHKLKEEDEYSNSIMQPWNLTALQSILTSIAMNVVKHLVEKYSSTSATDLDTSSSRSSSNSSKSKTRRKKPPRKEIKISEQHLQTLAKNL